MGPIHQEPTRRTDRRLVPTRERVVPDLLVGLPSHGRKCVCSELCDGTGCTESSPELNWGNNLD